MSHQKSRSLLLQLVGLRARCSRPRGHAALHALSVTLRSHLHQSLRAIEVCMPCPGDASKGKLVTLAARTVSGRQDSELSTAVVTAGWSDSNDMNPDTDAPLKYLTENLEAQLLPALGHILMDRDFMVASRAALVLARAGAVLGRHAEPFFQWAVNSVETQAREGVCMRVYDGGCMYVYM